MKINTLIEYIEEIKSVQFSEDEILLFRGHSDKNFILLPAILRDDNLKKREDEIYHDIMIDYPNEFKKNEHLSNLVKIQHFGSSTRLLDVTRNMLIALYFAVEDSKDKDGEVIVFKIKKSEMLHHASDKALILSCLPALSYEDREAIKDYCKENPDEVIRDRDLKNNLALTHLLHEIRGEFPAFETCIETNHLLNNYFVAARKDNERMQRQDGAMIIFGLGDVNLNHFIQKRITVYSSCKDEILHDLKICNINSSTIYPGIERGLLLLRDKRLTSIPI